MSFSITIYLDLRTPSFLYSEYALIMSASFSIYFAHNVFYFWLARPKLPNRAIGFALKIDLIEGFTKS